MSSFNKIVKTYLRNSAKVLAVVLLAAAYIIGNSPGEALHKLFHPQETVVHTVDQEKDSCHRAIYHQEKEDGCEHKSHISKVDKCTLCHALSHIDQIAISDSTFQFISTDVEVGGKIIFHHHSLADTNLPARAPPIA